MGLRIAFQTTKDPGRAPASEPRVEPSEEECCPEAHLEQPQPAANAAPQTQHGRQAGTVKRAGAFSITI
jgi:hypothetical protein